MNTVLLLVYWCSNCAEFICLAGVMAVVGGPISSISSAELNPVLSEAAPPTSDGVLVSPPLHLRAYLARAGGNVER